MRAADLGAIGTGHYEEAGIFTFTKDDRASRRSSLIGGEEIEGIIGKMAHNK